MTLQVGLQGTDGIVLASDTLLQQYEHGERTVCHVSKFLHGPNIVLCWSGDHVSEYAANLVVECSWKSLEERQVIEQLQSEGDKAWNVKDALAQQIGDPPLHPGTIRKVIAVHADMMFVLEIGTPKSIARRVFDRVISGDVQNTARYFMNKYANNCHNRPASELIRLAAHTILAGGEENSRGIGGLDILVVPKGEPPIILDEDQIDVLKADFAQCVRLIQDKLTMPFNY